MTRKRQKTVTNNVSTSLFIHEVIDTRHITSRISHTQWLVLASQGGNDDIKKEVWIEKSLATTFIQEQKTKPCYRVDWIGPKYTKGGDPENPHCVFRSVHFVGFPPNESEEYSQFELDEWNNQCNRESQE